MAKAAVQPPPSPIEVIDVESLPKKEVINVEEAVYFLSTTISSRGFTKSTAISVERHSEDRDLHFAIVASLTSAVAVEDDDDDLQILEFPPPESPFLRKRPFSGRSVREVGQSSNSATNQPEPAKEFVCNICVEEKDVSNSFQVQGCTHSYCTECISRYVASKLQDNITSIKCPVSECGGRLEPEHCRSILPEEVFDRWENALCEALILGVEKFYCPFKDCSGMLINDSKEAVKESECPYCRRLFCTQCKAPWHSEIDCKEYQKLNENEREDIMLMKFAEKQHWRRCLNCGFYVQKIDGCRFVKCRCGVEFCYSCGTKTTRPHYCEKCKTCT